MGGNDRFYVHSDVADVQDVAPNLATRKFDMMGENCDACERIYVHEAIYDAFLASFVAAVKSFVVGSPLDDDT